MKHFDPAHFRQGRSGQPMEYRRTLSAFEASLASPPLPDPEASPNLAEFYRYALDEAAIVAITDAKGTISSVNEKFCEISGYSPEELIGQNHRILQSGIHDKAFFRNLYKTIGSGRVWRGQICNRSKSGQSYWVDTTIVPCRSDSGQIERFIAIRFDITRQKDAERRLWKLAKTDSLTGLDNRFEFLSSLDSAIDESGGDERRIGIALIDIDNFKDINDSFGHDAGDLILQAVAERLRGSAGEVDIVARLGGDEFAVILPDCIANEISARIQNIADSFCHPVTIDGVERDITASIGVSFYPTHGNCGNELLKSSDIALYCAKENGRARSVIFDESLAELSRFRNNLQNDVQRALKENDLAVHYQPIIALDGITPPSVEALLRWNSAGHYSKNTSRFLEHVRDDATIRKLDLFALNTVIDQIAAWRKEGMRLDFVSVNAANCDFRTTHYVDRLLEAIGHGAIATSDICVEINELVMVGRDSSAALNEINRLHRAGVRIAFDDFGTGFASLRHLRDLPISIVKIDKSFVSSLAAGDANSAIVAGIIELAHKMGKVVVAEGVETLRQANYLLESNCDKLQGFLFSEAVSERKVRSVLENSVLMPSPCMLPASSRAYA